MRTKADDLFNSEAVSTENSENWFNSDLKFGRSDKRFSNGKDLEEKIHLR